MGFIERVSSLLRDLENQAWTKVSEAARVPPEHFTGLSRWRHLPQPRHGIPPTLTLGTAVVVTLTTEVSLL